MGQDKARLRLGGRSLLAQVRAMARGLGMPVRVVRRDLVPRCGPLGGVYTALRRSRAEALAFLSCDMPFVSAGLLCRVLDQLTPTASAVFVQAGRAAGFPFVLRRAVLPSVERQIATEDFSIQSLARRLRAKQLRVPAAQAAELFNVNTPAEWAEARRRWRAACGQVRRS